MTTQLSAPFRLRLLHLVILTTALLLSSPSPAGEDANFGESHALASTGKENVMSQ